MWSNDAMTDPMTSQLELRSQPLFVLTAELGAPQVHEPTPSGTRKVVPVLGGSFVGERLHGEIDPAGGHGWALVRADGSLVLDVRLVLTTHDGERVLMTYSGIRTGSPEALARLAAGEPVDPHEIYFRIAPRFETGSTKYAWLNGILAIGVGERLATGPRYTIFEIL